MSMREGMKPFKKRGSGSRPKAKVLMGGIEVFFISMRTLPFQSRVRKGQRANIY